MGRNLDWLYSHANRLEKKFKVDQFLKRNGVVHATKERFADDWAATMREELRGWKPEKLGKLIACGAANYTSPTEGGRTPMADMQNGHERVFDLLQDHTGSYALQELGVMVLLAAVYDVTVVTEGRRRSQNGEHFYEDNGRRCHHGQMVTIVDNGRQMQVSNPYWRPESVGKKHLPEAFIIKGDLKLEDVQG